MIVCDGCDRRLALAEARGANVVERDGRMLCAACAEVRSPDGPYPRCDGCLEAVTQDALRAGAAGALAGRLLCARCHARARRGAAARLDRGLVATAVLGVVALPAAVALAWVRFTPPPSAVAPSAADALLAEHTRELERLAAEHDREGRAYAERQTTLERELARARGEVEAARGRAAEASARDATDGELLGVEAAYRDAIARELAVGDATGAMLALWHVAEIGDPGLAGLVEARLTDADPLVRARAVQVLAGLGATRSLAAIVQLYGDTDPQVRHAAQEAARRLAGRPLIAGVGSDGGQ